MDPVVPCVCGVGVYYPKGVDVSPKKRILGRDVEGKDVIHPLELKEYLLSPGLFFLFHLFFIFVIMRSLFLRYKKPHAALAMEKTKPINQKLKPKESHGTG